ncbi:spore coat associated protein CotJA [Paludicola sp. MB14-C6]|uniref:spore coat associated protein CotJA n=1 Tax=Paludihabitans sp. MB14-C6 TaxID=3070656 RepID=UPI0027DB12B1|nr:spore coat associated protein CotJA [Paludicola sp. MB14-C6]WMJ22951.1 spore coat associated protein CotJA [Paludicola sp. MB14-C6]
MIDNLNERSNASTGDISIFTNQPISFGMAYVPYQSWDKTYEPAVGFMRGTLFPCLDKPFLGEEAIPNER